MGLNKYDENSIVTLSPRQSIIQNYGMYIGSNDSAGMHHLLTEIVANAMDEAAAGFGKIITINVNSKTNEVCIIDEGRGIPFRMNSEGKYAIKEMCTSLHSGGKFEGGGNYKSSLGLHGLGATVTNALSTKFSIFSKREDGECYLEFQDGEEKEFYIKDYKSKTTGSKVTFIPDSKMFGKNQWNQETIRSELQLHALLNNNLTFELFWDNKKVCSYCYSNGIKDMLEIKFGDNKCVTDATYHCATINKGKEDECEVELAIRYTNDGSEHVWAFTNGGYNPDYGTHVTGFKTAWTTLINKKAREYGLLEVDQDNLDGNLIRKGMFVILSLKMNERPMFAEQTKLKLTSPSARGFASQAVGSMQLSKVFVEAVVNKALIEKKSEEAAQRQRDAVKRISAGGKNINILKEVSEKFSDAIDKTGTELFLCEGQSAAGSAKEGRNQYKQAIYPLRGKPLNVHDKELADAIKNQEIKDILAILGCGVEDKFDIRNLRYDKIIIMADADVDGSHINCLLTTLFLKYLPELIEAGKVYCATPPLFKVSKGKDYHYLYEPYELDQYKGWEVTRYKGLGEQSSIELWESTMDPEQRHLIQLKPTDMQETLDLFKILMGNSSSDRKKFIMANALKYSLLNEDTEDMGDEE